MDARIRASFVGIAIVGAAFSVAATFLWSLKAGWSVAAGPALRRSTSTPSRASSRRSSRPTTLPARRAGSPGRCSPS